MMPQVDLDDKKFEELVEEALEELHRYDSDWTDHNLHDPGITFIELFSWLTEMQRYYLNRITDKSRESILSLLGIKKVHGKSAKTSVTVTHLEKDFFLPKGMKFDTGELIFESINSHWILANEIRYVYIEEDKKIIDRTRESKYQKIGFSPLGENVRKSNKLFLGFADVLPTDTPIEIFFECTGDGQRPTHNDMDRSLFAVPLMWEIYTGRGQWETVTVIHDGTVGFSQSGEISMMITDEMMEESLFEGGLTAYWLRAVVVENYQEIPRLMDNIWLNLIETVHRNQLVRYQDYSLQNLEKNHALDHYLQFFGENYLQVYMGNGRWKDVAYVRRQEMVSIYAVESDEDIVLDLLNRQLHLKGPLGDYDMMRLISLQREYLESTLIGPSLGTSNQVFDLHMTPVLYRSVCLQVGEAWEGIIIWRDWTEVDSFDFSSATDRHFRIDYDEGKLFFGDDIHGRIPERGDENIRIISLALGGGTRGNIREHTIKNLGCHREDFELIYPGIRYGDITLTNPVPALGGTDCEKVKDLHHKLLEDFHRPHVAVTSADYTAILKEMPGLSIERSHIIINYDCDRKVDAAGHITIVIVPAANDLLAKPSDNYRDMVKSYLESYRLLTVQQHIIGPEYVRIDISAIIYVNKDFAVTSNIMKKTMKKLLDPKGDEDRRWAFGETIKKSRIYRTLATVKGVDRVENLMLHSIHRDSKIQGNGDIAIKAYCLPYLGEFQIDIVVSN